MTACRLVIRTGTIVIQTMRSSTARRSLVYLFATTYSPSCAFTPTRRTVAAVGPLRGIPTKRFMSSNDEGLTDIGGNSSESLPSTAGEPLQSWRQLLEISSNKTRKIRGSNYVQVATVDAEGLPRCRTLVFRGFLSSVPPDHALGQSDASNLPCVMKMITDARSDKVSQIGTSPAVELVWWLAKTNEQYRIRGELVLVGPQYQPNDTFLQQARREQWGNLSDAARESFYDPQPPGHAYEKGADATAAPPIPPGGRTPDGKVCQPPPGAFLLLLLQPSRVDYLRLGAPEQYRQVDVRESTTGQWTSQRVNP
jgi:pyridoxamine 5'-phosphate oxidase